jgi:3-phosphoshikimate 1-carboxyvinyltransferase
MAVLGAYARGDTALVNAAHARIKETDRIAVMAAELGKLGVPCTENPGGLIVHGGEVLHKPSAAPGSLSGPSPKAADSRGDHRVAMALAVAALGDLGPAEIGGAESAAVTYPGFHELLGAAII